MKRRRKESHANHERWLVSYADFITLMFAFFVVMFATSQTDRGKAAQVSESVRKALEEGHFISAITGILGGTHDNRGKGNAQMRGPGGERKQDKAPPVDARLLELLPAMNLLGKELEEEIKAGKMQVSMEARGLVVSFREAAFFPSGADVIPPDTHGTIRRVAEVVLRLPNPIRLEGHTDSVPIRGGRFRSNWELSAARSIAMMELLVASGVPREGLSIAGYAENAPVETNDNEEGRRRNRRVDIVVLNKTGMSAEPSGVRSGSPEPPKPSPTGGHASGH